MIRLRRVLLLVARVTIAADTSLITPAGGSFIPLNSFDFTHLRVNFTKANIKRES
jgi:hypothetical protein